jgi:hypothetical protein
MATLPTTMPYQHVSGPSALVAPMLLLCSFLLSRRLQQNIRLGGCSLLTDAAAHARSQVARAAAGRQGLADVENARLVQIQVVKQHGACIQRTLR